MFGLFRRRKKDVETVGRPSIDRTNDVNLKSRKDEGRDPPKYFRKPREEEEIKLTEILGKLLQRLRNLDSQRKELVQQIYQLGEQAEEESEELEKELSILKGQITELEEVLSTIHAHRKGVRAQ